MLKKFAELWKPIALTAVFVILASLAIEFTVHLDESQAHLLESIDLAAIAVLAIELVVHFHLAKEKKKFLKENWLLIVALLPFGQALRALKALKALGKAMAGWLSKALHLITNSPKVLRAYRAGAVGYSKAREKLKGKKKQEKRRSPTFLK